MPLPINFCMCMMSLPSDDISLNEVISSDVHLYAGNNFRVNYLISVYVHHSISVSVLQIMMVCEYVKSIDSIGMVACIVDICLGRQCIECGISSCFKEYTFLVVFDGRERRLP